MSKVVTFPVNSCNMTVAELCDFVKSNPPDSLICIGLVEDDTKLYFKAAARMPADRALWIIELAKQHAITP